VENKPGWHGKALSPEQADRAIEELGGIRRLTVRGPMPIRQPDAGEAADGVSDGVSAPSAGVSADLPAYAVGEEVAPRLAFGQALKALGVRRDIVVLDAEVGNSTHTEEFGKAYPERFFDSFIAEQQMVATAVGLSARGYKPFAATFAAFLTRAHDFIRMAAISRVDLALVGTHCGVEIGEDGPSQMGLEDLAMMRSVLGSTVLYPSDATSAVALTATMAELPGISYLRATRGAYPVLYSSGESFPVGGSKTLYTSPDDQVALLAAGVTVHECLAAREQLAEAGVSARVIDLYSVKPLDVYAVVRAAAETRAVLVVEDHHPEGGLGEAVLSALAGRGLTTPFGHLAVRALPDSRTPAESLDAAGVSARHIERFARQLLDAASAASVAG